MVLSKVCMHSLDPKSSQGLNFPDNLKKSNTKILWSTYFTDFHRIFQFCCFTFQYINVVDWYTKRYPKMSILKTQNKTQISQKA